VSSQSHLRARGADVRTEELEPLIRDLGLPPEWFEVPRSRPAVLSAVFDVVSSVAPEHSQAARILSLRQWAWLGGNDRFRTEDARWLPYGHRPHEKDNLEALLQHWVPTSDFERVRHGDGLRQLGEYDSARAQLALIPRDSECAEHAVAILGLCAEGRDELVALRLARSRAGSETLPRKSKKSR
jgi:hypothetical protein